MLPRSVQRRDGDAVAPRECADLSGHTRSHPLSTIVSWSSLDTQSWEMIESGMMSQFSMSPPPSPQAQIQPPRRNGFLAVPRMLHFGCPPAAAGSLGCASRHSHDIVEAVQRPSRTPFPGPLLRPGADSDDSISAHPPTLHSPRPAESLRVRSAVMSTTCLPHLVSVASTSWSLITGKEDSTWKPQQSNETLVEEEAARYSNEEEDYYDDDDADDDEGDDVDSTGAPPPTSATTTAARPYFTSFEGCPAAQTPPPSPQNSMSCASTVGSYEEILFSGTPMEADGTTAEALWAACHVSRGYTPALDDRAVPCFVNDHQHLPLIEPQLGLTLQQLCTDLLTHWRTQLRVVMGRQPPHKCRTNQRGGHRDGKQGTTAGGRARHRRVRRACFWNDPIDVATNLLTCAAHGFIIFLL